jgi:integrase
MGGVFHRGCQPPTGHVFRVERKRGVSWYAKYRLPNWRQIQKKLGPARSERGRPPAGYFTKRLAENWLRETLHAARRGTLAGQVRTGATFVDAAAEWLRYVEVDRQRKPSRARRVWGLEANAAAEVEKPALVRSGDIQVFSPEEVWSLVRSAASQQGEGIYPTAAFTDLRFGELLALRWRDVDFAGAVIRVRASYAAGARTTPKSGKVRGGADGAGRSTALAQLGQREGWVGEDDLVFSGVAGGYLDGSSLRRRYKAALAAAGLRPLRFHDLRYTFGTRMIGKAGICRVQEWMGHADIQTMMRYLHYAPRSEDAALVAKAFALPEPGRAPASGQPMTASPVR